MLKAWLDRLRPASLKLRLVVLFAGLMSAALFIYSAYTAHRQSALVTDNLVTATQSLATYVADIAAPGVAANDVSTLSAQLNSLQVFAGIRAVRITDRQGSTLAAVARNAQDALHPLSPAEATQAVAAPPAQQSVAHTENGLSVWAPVGQI
ncbi:MAG: hypothetical protein KDE64_14640, partial [Rhodocyclaceae bacterium]|nr:hypothetical protein [Rhodocyclaceae bacterium]